MKRHIPEWCWAFSLQVKYTEQYEQSKGKGSFPAMITPGYQAAKSASALASNVSGSFLLVLIHSELCRAACIYFMFLQVEYKKGHDERVSKYTAFVDPPEVLLAKKQGQIVSDVSFWQILP